MQFITLFLAEKPLSFQLLQASLKASYAFCFAAKMHNVVVASSAMLIEAVKLCRVEFQCTGTLQINAGTENAFCLCEDRKAFFPFFNEAQKTKSR